MSFIKLLFVCSLFVGCKRGNTSESTSEPIDTTLRILTYGLPKPDEGSLRNAVAKQYGFQYESAAGCLVSEELIDSIHAVNRRSEQVLKSRYGANWESRIEEQVDSLRGLLPRILALVEKQLAADSASDKFRVQMPQEGDYQLHLTADPVVYLVDTYGSQGEYPNESLVVFYTYRVHLGRRNATLVDTTTRPYRAGS